MGISLSGCKIRTKCCRKDSYELHSPIRIVHVGRFSEQKNHLCIIEALSKLPKGRFRIDFWGEGELLQSVKESSVHYCLDDYVFFNGTTDDIYSKLSDSDIFVLPSKWEGIPMSMIEAMGTGLPIIASEVGGIPNMVSNGENALLIIPNSESLKEAIECIAESKELRIRLGVNAIRDSIRFSSNQMAKEYIRIYES